MSMGSFVMIVVILQWKSVRLPEGTEYAPDRNFWSVRLSAFSSV